MEPTELTAFACAQIYGAVLGLGASKNLIILVLYRPPEKSSTARTNFSSIINVFAGRFTTHSTQIPTCNIAIERCFMKMFSNFIMQTKRRRATLLNAVESCTVLLQNFLKLMMLVKNVTNLHTSFQKCMPAETLRLDWN